jgi:hypothetical protein
MAHLALSPEEEAGITKIQVLFHTMTVPTCIIAVILRHHGHSSSVPQPLLFHTITVAFQALARGKAARKEVDALRKKRAQEHYVPSASDSTVPAALDSTRDVPPPVAVEHLQLSPEEEAGITKIQAMVVSNASLTGRMRKRGMKEGGECGGGGVGRGRSVLIVLEIRVSCLKVKVAVPTRTFFS